VDEPDFIQPAHDEVRLLIAEDVHAAHWTWGDVDFHE
jgi:hypothetical protein